MLAQSAYIQKTDGRMIVVEPETTRRLRNNRIQPSPATSQTLSVIWTTIIQTTNRNIRSKRPANQWAGVYKTANVSASLQKTVLSRTYRSSTFGRTIRPLRLR